MGNVEGQARVAGSRGVVRFVASCGVGDRTWSWRGELPIESDTGRVELRPPREEEGEMGG